MRGRVLGALQRGTRSGRLHRGEVVDVLLLHAGIADSRMWQPQIDALSAAGFRVHAPDLRGFGERQLEPGPFSHARDAVTLLDQPAAIVGASLGGRVALELALLRPDLTERLVLIAPGLPGWSWSEETRAGWEAEESAFDRGDRRAAAEACLELWLDRPDRRRPVDPDVRSLVLEMVLRSYELQADAPDIGAVEEETADRPVAERLGEIACPTLVVVGEHDVGDMREIATHVARTIPRAELVTVPDAAHLPSLEQPDHVNACLLGFLH